MMEEEAFKDERERRGEKIKWSFCPDGFPSSSDPFIFSILFVSVFKEKLMPGFHLRASLTLAATLKDHSK